MTTTKVNTIQEMLQLASPDSLPDAFRKIDLGMMLASIKVTVTGLTAAAAIDITTAAVKAAATIAGITLETGENLPAIGAVRNLRVTASGTAGSLGVYAIGDTGATPIVPPGGAGAAVGVATLSDDGKTLTFPNTITAFILQYTPRAKVALTTVFERT